MTATDAELVATLIGGSGARPIARRLLASFGGLRPLLRADTRELLAQPGIGRVRAARLNALPDLARRYFAASLPAGTVIRSPVDTGNYLQARLGHLGHELFCCMYLDNRHRVLSFDEMFRGTIDGTSVYPREVVKEALAVNAAAVILAHNHPSGSPSPARPMSASPGRLRAALELVDIRLLDHLIIGAGRVTSLASRGML